MRTYHRLRNRESLTILMLHRVLPAAEQRRTCADPVYTMAPELLSECLRFFERHFSIVSLEDAILSFRKVRPLPHWPLLITFDDGWQDNLEWAAPVLQRVPWTLFVATDLADQDRACWQEVLLWAMRTGHAAFADLRGAATSNGARAVPADLPQELQLLLLHGSLNGPSRERAVAPFASEMEACCAPSRMLTHEEIVRLHNGGHVAIGAHGASHLPLTNIDDATGDMARARDWLRTAFPTDQTLTMSFPHGRWNLQVADAARRVGYELLFTSDPVLNPCPDGWLASDILGRVPLASRDIVAKDGSLAPPRLASWLYTRERKRIMVS